MRLARAIRALLVQEFTQQDALRRVEIGRSQAAPWDWVLFRLDPGTERAFGALLGALAPFRVGELLISARERLGIQATRDFVTAAVTTGNPTVEQVLRESPTEMRATFDRARNAQSEAVLVARLRRETALTDAVGLAGLVRDDTWLAFRSLPARLRKRRVELQLGAQAVNVDALEYNPIAAAETHEAQVSVFPADPATTTTVRTLAETGDVRRTRFPAGRIAEALAIAREAYYGFRISLPVEVEILVKGTQDVDPLATLESCSAGLRGARNYCRRSMDESVDATLRLLEARRQRSRSRDVVAVVDAGKGERVVGSVPTNEHEVLILAGKLEAYVGRVLPLFRIWEHTSQIGIDALVDIQLSRDRAQVWSATLEFEFKLRNFFRHAHPIRQTDFILCWTTKGLANGTHRYGDGDVDRQGAFAFDMRGEGWIRTLDFGDHLARVLILEQLPGLRTGPPAGRMERAGDSGSGE